MAKKKATRPKRKTGGTAKSVSKDKLHEVSILSADAMFRLRAKVLAKTRPEAASKLRKALKEQFNGGPIDSSTCLGPDISDFSIQVDAEQITGGDIPHVHDLPEEDSASSRLYADMTDFPREPPTIVVIGCPARREAYLRDHTNYPANWIFYGLGVVPPKALPPNDFVVEIHYHALTADDIRSFYSECGRPNASNIIVWSRQVSVGLARKIAERIVQYHRDQDNA